ncbi:dTMP kinase [Parahaliea mediterranea]|uniref:Thymidylate kinase n=1 Tax=Parahaliea mediterranea TaxID=651086 RepID=A0A939DGG3_9GAMM|nr:dTMP kinase [Parahaliea mediterranea]
MPVVQPRGLFITVEGGEGVGKSTNIAYLRDYLESHGVDLTVTREPGGTRLGEQLRELLVAQRAEAMDPMAELLIIFAARAQHLSEVIEPALAAGRWVLCDRFTDATYAYQSGGRGLDAARVRRLEQLVQGDLRPDFTLLFDAPVELGMARARERGELDRFEREEVAFFERVRGTYLRLARESSGRFRLIDAGQPLEAVREQLHSVSRELLDCWGVRH